MHVRATNWSTVDFLYDAITIPTLCFVLGGGGALEITPHAENTLEEKKKS